MYRWTAKQCAQYAMYSTSSHKYCNVSSVVADRLLLLASEMFNCKASLMQRRMLSTNAATVFHCNAGILPAKCLFSR
eukprot:12667-Heterococcus_DN1.PRE.1